DVNEICSNQRGAVVWGDYAVSGQPRVLHRASTEIITSFPPSDLVYCAPALSRPKPVALHDNNIGDPIRVIEKLHGLRLARAAELVEAAIEETLAYYAFPEEQLRTLLLAVLVVSRYRASGRGRSSPRSRIKA